MNIGSSDSIFFWNVLESYDQQTLQQQIQHPARFDKLVDNLLKNQKELPQHASFTLRFVQVLTQTQWNSEQGQKLAIAIKNSGVLQVTGNVSEELLKATAEAILQHNEELAIQLIEVGSFDINAAAKNGVTLLSIACLMTSLKVVERLLQKGASINMDLKDESPLHIICQSADELYQSYASITNGDLNKSDAENGQLMMPELLTSNDTERRTQIAKLLLDYKADPLLEDNVNNSTAIELAVTNNFESIVKLFLEKRNIDKATLNDLLKDALEHASLNIMRLLLDAGADIATKMRGGNALHLAVNQAVEVILFLLSKGLDIESKNKEGKTPLALACDGLLRHSAAVLLDHGADIEATDCNKHTILQAFCNKLHRCDQSKTLHFLLQNGAAG